ncbi:hypothetical protein NGM10_11930 [Halorussus salilacus]|uniref:hypothetical protein n=1 Tax=Halorussus salilacus TaxID=2953750 RepID=UPI00209C8E7E|nr:hypothetical protein [Halorussus salilacus]USZ67434.1 hypothetical protein NGM10_11930 [Halorussus salilacus]
MTPVASDTADEPVVPVATDTGPESVILEPESVILEPESVVLEPEATQSRDLGNLVGNRYALTVRLEIV